MITHNNNLTQLLSVICLFIILLQSCDKSEAIQIWEAGNQEFGWAEGSKNGAEWEASGIWTHLLAPNLLELDSSSFVIILTTKTSWGANREFISIKSFYWDEVEEGTYDVFSSENQTSNIIEAGYSLAQDDGDVLWAIYDLDESEHNFITIDYLDRENRIVGGTFQLHFNQKTEVEELPDKVRFSEGKFEVSQYIE